MGKQSGFYKSGASRRFQLIFTLSFALLLLIPRVDACYSVKFYLGQSGSGELVSSITDCGNKGDTDLAAEGPMSYDAVTIRNGCTIILDCGTCDSDPETVATISSEGIGRIEGCSSYCYSVSGCATPDNP